MKKICIITGARSEYGLLAPLMRELMSAQGVKLQVMATGMHLSPKFGSTWREINRDGFKIDARVKFPLPDEKGTAVSIARALEGIAAALAKLKPDLVVLLGDRFESFAAATAAYTQQIPIAHLHGGELTAGVLDEGFRHSITKMSSLHFTATAGYRRRVIQLGEKPVVVFNVGAIGLDNVRKIQLIDRKTLGKEIGFDLSGEVACITFHPAMFEAASPEAQLKELFKALDNFPRLKLIFTLPNADKGAGGLIKAIKAYAAKNRQRAAAFASLGVRRYLSLLKISKVVVGNSSSGIIEAPSMRVPTVNIGARQEGRARPASVIDCAAKAGEITRAIGKALSPAFAPRLHRANPYGDGRTAPRISRIIQREAGRIGVKKAFYDLNGAD